MDLSIDSLASCDVAMDMCNHRELEEDDISPRDVVDNLQGLSVEVYADSTHLEGGFGQYNDVSKRKETQHR